MKLHIIAMVLILLSSCTGSVKHNNTDPDAPNEYHFASLSLSDKKILSFYYDSVNYDKFGAKFYEHDLPVGQQDIMLHEENIYVLDRFHNNIKVLNMDGELLKSTSPLSKNSQLWLKQIDVLNDNFIVISELDSIYIFNKDLSLIGRKYLKKGNGRIFYSSRDKVVLYYPQNEHEFIEIDANGKITKSLKGLEHKYDYPSLTDFSKEGTVKCDGKIFYCPKDLDLQDKIFDIDNTVITYFDQNNDSLRIFLMFFEEISSK